MVNYTGKELEIKKALFKDGVVQLHQFFKDYVVIRKRIVKLKYKKKQELMKFSYSEAIPSSIPNLNKFLEKILGKEVKFKSYLFQRRDYTILHDDLKQKPGIDVIIDFTNNWPENAGGQVIYVDGKGNYTKIPVIGNSLTLIRKNQNKFVKYINHYGKDRYLVMGHV